MNYYERASEKLALCNIRRNDGLSVVILEGPPGTGKTAWTQHVASELGAKYFYSLMHHWISDEDLFVGVHVGRVAAGVNTPEDAYELGILAKAAISSQTTKTVVCLDEIDKAPQRAEALLLDFLQHGRVFGPCREVWQANLSNLIVCLTTNDERPLMEATLRRGFRVKMGFLPASVEADIIRKATGCKMSVINSVVAMMTIIRNNGETSPSLQEARNLVFALPCATTSADCEILIRGYLIKSDADWAALTASVPNPGAALWGETRR